MYVYENLYNWPIINWYLAISYKDKHIVDKFVIFFYRDTFYNNHYLICQFLGILD